MRFVGPITPGQIDGKPSPIKDLAWMLERIGFFVEKQLRADGFYGLEVKLIPAIGDKVMVAEYKDRENHHAYEKVRMNIPEDLRIDLKSPAGEEITLRLVPRGNCDQGIYVMSAGRLD